LIPLFKSLVSHRAKKEVARVLDSGWIGLGPEVALFEREFAKYVGCKHAIALNSGTEALRLAVHYWCPSFDSGFGVGLKIRNTKVLTTPNTFVSTNHVLLQNKFWPIFADIDPNTGALDLDSVRRMCRKYDPGGLMVVHYGGMPIDLDGLYSIVKEFDLGLIEDAAHACGAAYRGFKIGGTGQTTCFSFHAVKNLNIGDGGMITTEDDDFAKFCHNMRWLGIDKSTISRASDKQYSWDYDVTDLGYKAHMNDIMAAIGRVQLRELDMYNQWRTRIHDQYVNELKGVQFLSKPKNATSAHHLMVIRSPKKQEICSALQNAEIGFGYHYKPNYLYKIYEAYSKDGEMKGMEEFYKTAISLPMNLFLRHGIEIPFICKTINKVTEGI